MKLYHTFICFSNWAFFKLASLRFFSKSEIFAFALSSLSWYCSWGYYWTLPVHRTTCSRSWWVTYHLLSNLESSFSFFMLWLYFLSRVLLFVFNIFCSNMFLFYLFKLVFWNWNIRQIMYVFSFPSTPVSSRYMSIISIKSIGSKMILYCDWISDFSLGRR